MESTVFIRKVPDYDQAAVDAAVEALPIQVEYDKILLSVVNISA